MQSKLTDINEKDLNALPVTEDLHEVKPHGNLEFPVEFNTVKISKTNIRMIRWHWHEEIEVIYVQSGRIQIYADDYSSVLNEGQSFFINQNVLHSIHQYNSEDAIFYSVIFHPSFMFGYGRTQMSVKYQTPILENPNLKFLLIDFEMDNGEKFISYFKKLDIYFREKPIGYELIVKSLLCYIWFYLLQLSNITIPTGSRTKRIANDELRIKEAILFIEKHYTEQITLEDIADSIHISKSECCRCFKRVLRLSPFDYLLKYRIFASTKMMQRHDPAAATISELAISVGFSNISYYNKVFKKHLNLTPTEYKRKYKMYVPAEDELYDQHLTPFE